MYRLPLVIRWSDLDPNFHLRHSVYYDYAAYCRIQFLTENGLGPAQFEKAKAGPILFREEAVFRKEIKFGDEISIDLQLEKARRDYSRWTFSHRILKQSTVIAAVITIDGAWLDTIRRKLAPSPPETAMAFDRIPRSSSFEWTNT